MPPVSSDFWALTTVFEPVPRTTTLGHLALSARALRAQGVPLAIVELAFGDAPFRVADEAADLVVRRRSRTTLWHKERLLTLGVAALPEACRAVAWIDADVIFEDAGWADATRAQLKTVAVVQPFETACWLGPGETAAAAGAPTLPGFAATMARTADRRAALTRFERHGHTGFAWAARRDFLTAHGLYDRAIVGGGDFIAAHAFAADHDYLRGRHLALRRSPPAERAAIAAWGTPVAEATGGRIGWVPGRVLHLHHGDWQSRGYDERQAILHRAEFDPMADLTLDEAGCWQWASDKPALHAEVAAYFAARAAVDAPSGAIA
ncbi:MAG: hypothetical protein Q8L86_05325 [Vicinamibacterales bacterium]|nr:hypothetical protein [Vicinamibacterales bacterium]